MLAAEAALRLLPIKVRGVMPATFVGLVDGPQSFVVGDKPNIRYWKHAITNALPALIQSGLR